MSKIKSSEYEKIYNKKKAECREIYRLLKDSYSRQELYHNIFSDKYEDYEEC